MRTLTHEELPLVAGGFLNDNIGVEQTQANLANGGPGGPGGFAAGGPGGTGNSGVQEQTGDNKVVATKGGAVGGVVISF